jgi:hypothetical protein
MNTGIWLLVGLGLCTIGIAIYCGVYLKKEKAFAGLSTLQTVLHLISNVPDDNSQAWPHIVAGVLTTLGLCLIASGTIVSLPFVAEDRNTVGLALTAGGLAFGVLISSISFWTLWQTRRIEQLQGARLEGFPSLIEIVASELDNLVSDLRLNNWKPRAHHRVYLVTKNPFFGRLSFPTEKFTERYTDALGHVATAVNLAKNTGAVHDFDVQFLCGDSEALNEFHSMYFPSSDPLKRFSDEALAATAETESLLEDLKKKAGGKDITKRIHNVPETQFAVVGSVVFEFILESRGSQAEVHSCRRIRDQVVCDRFVDTFKLLKLLP